MKKLLPIIILSILLTNIPYSNANKVHHNDFHIIGGKAQYTVRTFCITPHQPYSKILDSKYDKKENYTGLTVFAGRKGSKKVAKCFKNWISAHQNTFNKNPKKLNFAIQGSFNNLSN